MVQRKHLVGKIGDDDAGMAGAVVVAGIGAHAGAGHPVFTEGNTRRECPLFERSVLLVEIKFVGLGVVGEQNVGPSVAVVIENGDAQALGGGIVESCLLRRVFKFPVA